MKVLVKAEQALQSRRLLLCVPSTDSAKEVLRFLDAWQLRHIKSASCEMLTQQNPGCLSHFVLLTFICPDLCEKAPFLLPLWPLPIMQSHRSACCWEKVCLDT